MGAENEHGAALVFHLGDASLDFTRASMMSAFGGVWIFVRTSWAV